MNEIVLTINADLLLKVAIWISLVSWFLVPKFLNVPKQVGKLNSKNSLHHICFALIAVMVLPWLLITFSLKLISKILAAVTKVLDLVSDIMVKKLW